MMLVFGATNAFSNWKGCIYDKCTGKPLANYPVLVSNPSPDGVDDRYYTFYTNSDGCFTAYGSKGSELLGFGNGPWNGGTQVDLGNLYIHGIGSSISLGGTTLHQGNSNSVDVYNHKVYGCNENFFTHSNPYDLDMSKYCVKIEIYQRHPRKIPRLVKVLDWQPFKDSRGGIQSLIDFTEIMNEFPQGTYRIRVQYKCCHGDKEESIGYTAGNFVWIPAVKTGDVEFNWIGSSHTESINNDGNPNDNSHPADGNTYYLGQLTCGVNWNIVPGSGAVTEVTARLFKIDDPTGSCQGDGIKIYNKTWSADQLPDNFSFNAETEGYFLNAQDYIVGQTCFRFEVEIKGHRNCPETVKKDGYFRIATGNPWGLTDNSSSYNASQLHVLKEENRSLGTRNTRSENVDIYVYPNPVLDQLHISGHEHIQQMSIIDTNGKIHIYSHSDGHVDMKNLPSGIYLLKMVNKNGESTNQRIVKI